MTRIPWYKKLIDAFRRRVSGRTADVNNSNAKTEEASKANSTKSMVVKRLGMAFDANGSTFEEPAFDLTEVEKAYNTESYVRQAVDKYVDLTFKEGWLLKGKNVNSVDYIKARFRMLGIASGTPMDQFLLEMSEDLVKYSNVFIIKARAKAGSTPNIPGVRIAGIDGKQPVTAYFLLNPTTITIRRDKNGNIQKYKQTTSGQSPVEYNAEDIIHITYKKDRGYAFGQPIVTPCIDDIKALRDAEENVLRLIYQHLFPFYVYTVGLAQPGYEATDDEIEKVKDTIQNMAVDGGMVVPERHNIEIKTAAGAFDAAEYLQYFEKRVFTGLGVSEVQMGRGGTSNRSTSDTLSSEMHDRVKAFQKTLTRAIDFQIIYELLVEGGFDPLTNPDDDVSFVFNEIELDAVIKMQNHMIYKYEHNAVTEDEMRQELGMDPITDRGQMFVNLVSGTLAANKTAETDNKVEPQNTPKKKTAPSAKPSKTTKPAPTKKAASKEDDVTDVTESFNKDKVNVTKYEEELNRQWALTKSDVIDMVKDHIKNSDKRSEKVDPKLLGTILQLTADDMKRNGKRYNKVAFDSGMTDARLETSWSAMPDVELTAFYNRINSENEKTIDRLMDRLSSMLSKSFKSVNNEDLMANVLGIFASLEYRLGFIANTESMKSYNYGYCVASKALDRMSVKINIHDNEESCQTCMEHKEQIVSLDKDFYDMIPPWHPNCYCTVKMINK
jgi:hypothetical protein